MKIGSVQRRRDRHHHHDHGAGDENTARQRAARVPAVAAGLFKLVLSSIYVDIYWNNHHHMLHACGAVTGAILWANLHLLFWLSLFPFTTGWMGENHFTAVPTALYGVVLLMAAIAYYLLQQTIIRAQGQDSILKKAFGRDWKGKLSPLLYVIALIATLHSSWLAQAVLVIAALIWLIPDRRIERYLALSQNPAIGPL